LAREVAVARGSASRVTVRKRLSILIDEGIIKKNADGSYRLRE
jgi:DNA-binding GntR family transcriptional regulator